MTKRIKVNSTIYFVIDVFPSDKGWVRLFLGTSLSTVECEHHVPRTWWKNRQSQPIATGGYTYSHVP